MNTIKFRIAAKTDVGIVRTNNEDNFQAAADLSDGKMRWINNEICFLGEKGALLVVADGMGGMNAGEVASEIAIQTVREYFLPENLTPEVLKSRFSIEKYMNKAIIAADSRIKSEAKEHPETRGMGTTIVIGWVLDGKLYVSWCGDSRAYIYNPQAGLHQITKDHSYVQGLVDKGSLTRDEAFDFPDSNIITRCLSDSTTKAKPESLLKPIDVCDNDIIILCTDGLSGMIRDCEIESIIKNNEHNMDDLTDELIKGACNAEGSDNITICLMQILQGGKECDPSIFNEYDNRLNGNRNNITTIITHPDDDKPNKKRRWNIILSCLGIIIIGGIIWWILPSNEKTDIEKTNAQSIIQDVAQKSKKESSTPPGTGGGTKQDSKESPVTNKKDDVNKPVENINDKPKQSGSIFTPSSEKPIEELLEEDELTPIPQKPNVEDIQAPQETDIPTEQYEVQNGDTYFGLAKKYGVAQELLQELNDYKPLKAGGIIVVPKK